MSIASATHAGESKRLDRRRVIRQRQRRSTCDQLAGPSAATARRWSSADELQPPRRRAHAAHRPIRAPANRPCSAPSPASGRSAAARSPIPANAIADDVAAAAVFPDRIPARSSRLSRRSRDLQPDRVREVLTSWACRNSLHRLEEDAHWNRMLSLGEQQRLGWRARCCTRRNICSSMKRPLRSMSPRGRAVSPARRKAAGRPPSSRSATARRSNAFHQRHVAMVRDGDRFTVQDAASIGGVIGS